VLFTVAGIRVYSYQALLYLGLVGGFYAMYLVAPRVGVPPPRGAAAALVLMIPALLGARIWFVAAHWPLYRGTPGRIWRRSEGGMALYGGLALSLIVSPAVLAAFGIPFASFWDAATFTMLVGMIFTRVGCLLNGCCCGRPTTGRFGMRLSDVAGRYERRYPVQLLEMACAVTLLAIALVMLAARPPAGSIFAVAFAGYGVCRLALDRLREPERPGAYLRRAEPRHRSSESHLSTGRRHA
jgi:prolipoprotein diacylglyceryltransferase